MYFLGDGDVPNKVTTESGLSQACYFSIVQMEWFLDLVVRCW